MNKMDFEKLKNAGFEWEKSIKKSGLSSFKAGAQSRQAEIDELQKRIDDALKILQEMKHNGAYRATYILKGNEND